MNLLDIEGLYGLYAIRITDSHNQAKDVLASDCKFMTMNGDQSVSYQLNAMVEVIPINTPFIVIPERSIISYAFNTTKKVHNEKVDDLQA